MTTETMMTNLTSDHPMLDSAPAPVLVRSCDAERLGFPDGSTMALLADSAATGGAISIHRSVLVAGAGGANPHHHTAVTEVIYVVSGQIEALVGDEIVVAGEGDLAVVPPGVVHAFAALPGVGAELLIATTPGVERFPLWRRIQLIVTGREPVGDLVADQATAYDTHPDVCPEWDDAHNSNTTTHPRRTDMNTSLATLDAAAGPTEHRTMNTVIHAAFRRDLRRLSQALECFPAGSRARADQITAAWKNISFQLHVHHQDEEHLFWPAFLELGVDSGLVTELESEHGQMVDALTWAENAMSTFASDPSAANVATAHVAVGELARVLHEHLVHEERDLEPFGAEHDHTRQHKQAVAMARKSHTEGAGTFFAWLADTDDPSIAPALRRQVPRPVLFLLITFGGRSYRRCAAAAWGSQP